MRDDSPQDERERVHRLGFKPSPQRGRPWLPLIETKGLGSVRTCGGPKRTDRLLRWRSCDRSCSTTGARSIHYILVKHVLMKLSNRFFRVTFLMLLCEARSPSSWNGPRLHRIDNFFHPSRRRFLRTRLNCRGIACNTSHP